MLNRRSVRAYAAEPVPEDKLEKILQAGLLAPISKNRKPCEFYVIRDKAVLKELSKAYSKLHIEGDTRTKRKQLAELFLQKT